VRLARHWPSRLSEVAQPEKETTSSARHHALIICMSVRKWKTSASALLNRRTLHLGWGPFNRWTRHGQRSDRWS